MIHFVTTRDHRYTITNLIRRHGRTRCRWWSYERLLQTTSVPSGTWVFTDHERLSDYENNVAANIATKIEATGNRVLNHPGRVQSRLETLRRLYHAGINHFTAYACDAEPLPDRFPVFIRNSFDHKNQTSRLLYDQGELETEFRRLTSMGQSLRGKILIEFAGEEVTPGVWRRLSTYRIGDSIIAHHVAFDRTWCVKDGFSNRDFDTHPDKALFLDMERQVVTNNQYSEVLLRAFNVAGIDYGRADFGIVHGSPQIFEINTNPDHGPPARHSWKQTHPEKLFAQQRSEEALQAAIGALSSPSVKRVAIWRRKYWWALWQGRRRL